MNDKNKELLRIVDVVVECCAMEVEHGGQSLTATDVLGKCKTANVVMTRCVLCRQIVGSGYSVESAALLLHRTQAAIRHLLALGSNFASTSRAFRIAEAEAKRRCREEIPVV